MTTVPHRHPETRMRMPRIRNVERIVDQVPFPPRYEEWNPLLVGRWRI